jgi:hypothetical protein
MMNCAAISFTSKHHTTTDESTTASEITEAYLLACDVGCGMVQNAQRRFLWQDKQSAIHIAMNCGSLAKKPRAFGIRVLSIRNKIEDMIVVSHYLKTDKMLAYIETKTAEGQTVWLCRLG